MKPTKYAAMLRLQIQSILGDIMNRRLLTSMLGCSLALGCGMSAAQAAIVINEVDYDLIGTDAAEFIELKNTSAGAVDLSAYSLRLINGSNSAVYQTFNLPSVMLAAGDYYVICGDAVNTPNCDLDVAPNTDLIQNGAPDGIQLVIIATSLNEDGMAYEGSMPCCTEGTALPASPADDSVTANFGYSRFPDGSDSNDNLADFSLHCITPGTVNVAANSACPAPVNGTPTLSISNVTANEGDSPGCVGTNFNFTVTASSPAPAGGITFTYSTADGTATLADGDYTQVIAGSASIAAAATTGTATVVVGCDKNAEANEDFTVNLLDGVDYDLGAPSTATGTINDDDTPTVTVADVAIVEGDSGTQNLTFTVQLDREAPAGGFGYNFDTSDGSATAGIDYVGIIGAAGGIIAGSSSSLHVVTINGDTDIESNETFTFTLSAASPVAATGNDFVATGTIQNDDFPTTPTFVVSDASDVTEDNGQGVVTASFLITLAPAPAGPVSLDVATLAGTAGAGDFTALPTTTLSFGPGTLTQVVNVTILADTVLEATERFTLEASNATGGALIGDGTGQVDIIDDDINQSLSIGDLAINEGDVGSSTASFTVSLAAPVPVGYGSVTVNFATANNTAIAPSDYTSNSGTVTFLEGESNHSIPVTIIGDLTAETDETYFVNLSNATGTNVSIGNPQATGTITDDDTAPVRTIAEIQGLGFQSPFNNTDATILDSVVTGLVSNGFFVQDPTPDPLLATSDAMFVFTSTLPTVAVGDRVDLRGTISEAAVTVPAGAPNYSGLTKLLATGLVISVTSVGNALPTPFVLDDAMPSPAPAAPFCVVAGGNFTPSDFASTKNFECLESLRVSTTMGVTNAPMQSFSGDLFAEINITSSGRRAFREAGMTLAASAENLAAITLTPPAPALAAVVWDNNPEVFEVDQDRLVDAAGVPLLLNPQLVPGSHFSASGVLGFEFGGYELFPDTINVFAPAPPIPGTVPTAGPAQLTVASLNMLRFYDRCDDPTRPNTDEVVNLAQVTIKLDKLSRYIREVLKSPDVIGAQEVEQASVGGTVCANGEANVSTLQLLADKILADGGPSYTPVLAPLTNDIGWINVGFLVQAARVNIGVTQHIQADHPWVFNGLTQTQLHDRPSLLLEATTLFTPTPLDFTVIVNHLRSLSGIDTLTNTTTQTNAHRVRQKRLRQAVDVACAAQAYQSVNPTRPLILIGDFNAFQFADGYADTLGILRGDTVPSQSEYGIDFIPPGERCDNPFNGQVVSPALAEAVFSLPPDERYSFYFRGVPQELDHGLLSTTASQRFEKMAYGRGNADSRNDQVAVVGNALRSSDHDGFVLYLNAGTGPTNNGFTLFKDGFE